MRLAKLAPCLLAIAACDPAPDPQLAQLDQITQTLEQRQATQQSLMARIHGPDVVQLPAHSDVPKAPGALRGLKVLVASKVVSSHLKPNERDPLGNDHMSAQEAAQGCAKNATSIFEQLGWIAVLDPSRPHDIVMRADCTGNVAIDATGGAMYVLLPSEAGRPDNRMRFESPAGDLIDEMPSSPITLACPAPDEAQCVEAVKEWSLARVVGNISASTKLADYVARHPPSGG